MNSTDNEIRVLEENGEKYVVVNDLMKVLKVKDLSKSQWVRNKKSRLKINFLFYDGVYIISQSDARTIIKNDHQITKDEKNILCSRLGQVNVFGRLKPKEKEKYEFVFKEDLPFLDKKTVELLLSKKKLSHSDFKQEIGWSHKTSFSDAFTGRSKVSLHKLKKMADVLETTVSMIVIPADEAPDEIKANYQKSISHYVDRKRRNRERENNEPIINADKEAIIATLNKIDVIKVSMKKHFEAQQEELETQQKRFKILQAQLEDIEHETAYLRDALVGSSSRVQVDEDDYLEEEEQ